MNLILLQSTAAAAAAMIVAAIGFAYARYVLQPTKNAPHRARGRAAVSIVLLAVLGLSGFYVVFTSPTSAPPKTPTPNPTAAPLYGFESDTMGWQPETSQRIRGVLQVKRSSEQAKSGTSSLEVQVDLRGGNDNYSKGKAFVDLRSDPLPGLEAPLNLETMAITVWVYAPKDAVGDPQKPNGVKVVVMDANSRSEYGQWHNLTNSERWMAINLNPTKNPPPSVVMDAGFDPSRIIWLGIEIAAGADSAATYRGSVWIDDVLWQMR